MSSEASWKSRRPRSMSASMSPVLGRQPLKSKRKHFFQHHNYKRPTFCVHCKQLLVGLVRQGLRCKRCDIDVHSKCQEDLEKQCVEIIVDHHHFRVKSFKQFTYCDYCYKLLVGVMDQGLKCTECGATVHDRCQEKIEVKCSDVTRRLQLRKSSLPGSSSWKRKELSRLQQSESLSASLQNLPEITAPSDTDDQIETTQCTMDYLHTPASVPTTPTKHNRKFRSRSLTPCATEELQKSIEEINEIMKVNMVKVADEREEKLRNLKIKSQDLTEKSKLFHDHTKEAAQRYWWRNNRMWVCLGVAAVLVGVIIVLVVIFSSRNGV